MVTLSTLFCGAAYLSIHSVLRIWQEHLSMPINLHLSVYRSQATSRNPVFQLQIYDTYQLTAQYVCHQ